MIVQYASKKTFQTVPFKRSCGDCAFCVKGPFNLNGRNSRTTAGVDLHRTRNRSAHIPSFLIDTCIVFFSTPEIEQELERVFRSIAEADDGLRRLYRVTNSHLLQNYKPPAMHKSIELWAFPFNARFNYSAAPRALKLYQTVYLLKTRRRSFHTFTRLLFLNDAIVYTAFISNGMERFF